MPHIDRSWHEDGICNTIDPYQWFPEGQGETGKIAKDICATCPVMEQCREYGILYEPEFGIWGGLSARQRKKIREERGLQPLESPALEAIVLSVTNPSGKGAQRCLPSP